MESLADEECCRYCAECLILPRVLLEWMGPVQKAILAAFLDAMLLECPCCFINNIATATVSHVEHFTWQTPSPAPLFGQQA